MNLPLPLLDEKVSLSY